jgi:GntR family transcriptional repressor for pyruvate dehydrogenase complex
MTNRRNTADGLFSPVSSGRLSEEIFERIRAAIVERRLRPGDRLPSERELTERFNVSRVSVRDALRILEASGLVEIRVGAHGGAFVTVPEPGLVGEGIAHMLYLSEVSPAEVTEARVIFELGMLPLVCARATDEDIEALDEMCVRAQAEVDAGTYHVELSAEFHRRLARAAHNRATELMADTFYGPLLMSLARAKAVAPEMGQLGVREHMALVDAIRARDSAAAHTIMLEHLGRTARRLGLSTDGDIWQPGVLPHG